MRRKRQKAENRWLQWFMVSKLIPSQKIQESQMYEKRKDKCLESALSSPAGLTNAYEQNSEAVRFETLLKSTI